KRNVTILSQDVNRSADGVRAAMPRFDRTQGLLSFCFVDPFSTDFKFEVLRRLSSYRIDVLVLLMLGWDARVNFL
ncbi:MAG: hypothetical protein ACRD4P_18485, partial [Bryobacteraceae bacterium]